MAPEERKEALPPSFPAMEVWWKDRRTIFLLLFTLAATFLVMSPALNHDFVNWDDYGYLVENEEVKNLSFENVRKIFTQPTSANYNPLTLLTLSIEHHFIGLDPFYYHLNNILLHVLTTFLVFWFMTTIGVKGVWAVFIALLCGIHPMRVESVAWVTERKDVLFGLFYLAALISYVSYVRIEKKRYLLLAAGFFIPALLAKIQAVSLPLCLCLIDYLMKRPLNVRIILEKIPFFLLSLFIGLLGIYFLADVESLGTVKYTFGERILVGAGSLWVYLFRSIFPKDLSAIYPYPSSGGIAVASSFLVVAIEVALAYLLYRSRKYTRALIFGAFFFLFNVMFLLQMVNAGQGFLADRFTYIPYIGLFFCYGTILSSLYKKNTIWKPIVLSVALLSPIIYSVMSWKRVGVWKNTETLFTDVIEKHPALPRGYSIRAGYYVQKGQNQKAIHDYSTLISLRPDHTELYFKRAHLLVEQKKYNLALLDYNHILEIDPKSAAAYQERGITYGLLGKHPLALEDLNKALEIDSKSAPAYRERGVIYGLLGNHPLALENLNRAMELDPTVLNGFKTRALAYFHLHQFKNAIQDARKHQEMSPEDDGNLELMALSQIKLEDLSGAIESYSLAIEINPENGFYYKNRAFLHYKTGHPEKALKDANQAQKLGVKMNPALMEKLKR